MQRLVYDGLERTHLMRKQARSTTEPHGRCALVRMPTLLEDCGQHDRDGLCAKARAGVIKRFTGISDPYEQPGDAAVVIDTTDTSAEEAAHQIILRLERDGYLGPSTQ